MHEEQQRFQPIRAGGIDWAASWREKTEARMAVGEGDRTASAGPRSTDSWDSRAERFARMTRELDVESDPIARALRAVVQPSDTVLDVGAGAGRYTFAVAPLVTLVTAVEPSRGMRDSLAQQATARGITNVTIVPGRWEEVAVEAHDVAFVSSVLYFVPDAVPFLEKLDQCARRVCAIFHRVEERAAVLGPGWREPASRRPPEPGFLDLYNLLYAMGIHANARILRTASDRRYGSIEAAMEEARQLLGMSPADPRDDSAIRQSLAGSLVQDKRGLRFPGIQETGMIWWEKAG